MPLHKLSQLLNASDELKVLAARTRRMRELQALYLGSVPRELAQASRIKNFQRGTLVIAADNAAIATKLRQMAPRLLTTIRKTEAEITGIRIEVQVRGAARERVALSRKTALTRDAVEKFEALSKQVVDADLKSALAALACRHRRAKTR